MSTLMGSHTLPHKSQYVADYPFIAPTLPGQHLPWLTVFRADAFAQFSAQGFPSLREEEWRYTNVSGIEKKRFSSLIATASSPRTLDALSRYQLADCYSVVLLDGVLSAQHSLLTGLPEAVQILSMAEALNQQADLVQQYLGTAVAHQEHSFVAFNGAWFNDGVFIQIPARLALSKPIQILNLVTQADALLSTRNVVVLAAQAEATLIETFATQAQAGIAPAYFSTAVTELFIGQNAQLTHYQLQAASDKAYHFSGSYAKQAREARLIQHNFQFGGLVARHDSHTELALAAECSLNGLYSGVQRQHLDNHTRIVHQAPHAISRELYKGILDDRARGVFQGRVIVAQDAQQTDSQMNNRNLLLSSDAEVDAKPQLEIYADDVKCAHGMTIGQLEEKSVFYLQSRGVDADTARNMLTFAFANEMVDKITVKSLHDLVLTQLLARFPQEGVDKDWL